MEYSVRHIDLNADYEMLTIMWKGWDFPPPPEEMLPMRGLIVADASDEPLAAGFLYVMPDVPICWMEWVVGNPFCTKEERNTGLNILIDHLTAWAESEGCTAMFTSSASIAYSKRLLEHKWIKSDENVTHFIRRLD